MAARSRRGTVDSRVSGDGNRDGSRCHPIPGKEFRRRDAHRDDDADAQRARGRLRQRVAADDALASKLTGGGPARPRAMFFAFGFPSAAEVKRPPPFQLVEEVRAMGHAEADETAAELFVIANGPHSASSHTRRLAHGAIVSLA